MNKIYLIFVALSCWIFLIYAGFPLSLQTSSQLVLLNIDSDGNLYAATVNETHLYLNKYSGNGILQYSSTLNVSQTSMLSLKKLSLSEGTGAVFLAGTTYASFGNNSIIGVSNMFLNQYNISSGQLLNCSFYGRDNTIWSNSYVGVNGSYYFMYNVNMGPNFEQTMTSYEINIMAITVNGTTRSVLTYMLQIPVSLFLAQPLLGFSKPQDKFSVIWPLSGEQSTSQGSLATSQISYLQLLTNGTIVRDGTVGQPLPYPIQLVCGPNGHMVYLADNSGVLIVNDNLGLVSIKSIPLLDFSSSSLMYYSNDYPYIFIVAQNGQFVAIDQNGQIQFYLNPLLNLAPGSVAYDKISNRLFASYNGIISFASVNETISPQSMASRKSSTTTTTMRATTSAPTQVTIRPPPPPLSRSSSRTQSTSVQGTLTNQDRPSERANANDIFYGVCAIILVTPLIASLASYFVTRHRLKYS